eukprot:scaffold12441_cov29-Tisochrysis_lutea.AAC.2
MAAASNPACSNARRHTAGTPPILSTARDRSSDAREIPATLTSRQPRRGSGSDSAWAKGCVSPCSWVSSGGEWECQNRSKRKRPFGREVSAAGGAFQRPSIQMSVSSETERYPDARAGCSTQFKAQCRHMCQKTRCNSLITRRGSASSPCAKMISAATRLRAVSPVKAESPRSRFAQKAWLRWSRHSSAPAVTYRSSFQPESGPWPSGGDGGGNFSISSSSTGSKSRG